MPLLRIGTHKGFLSSSMSSGRALFLSFIIPSLHLQLRWSLTLSKKVILSFFMVTTLILWNLVSMGSRNLQRPRSHAQFLVYLDPLSKHDTNPGCYSSASLVHLVLGLFKCLEVRPGRPFVLSVQQASCLFDKEIFKHI
jgi:hypothetical protein